MIYRMALYEAVEEHLSTFHQFFRERLLPIQEKYGARLVGRWETEDTRVIAVWEYDDVEAYNRIRASVESDPDFITAQEFRKSDLPSLFNSREEVMMSSTLEAGS